MIASADGEQVDPVAEDLGIGQARGDQRGCKLQVFLPVGGELADGQSWGSRHRPRPGDVPGVSSTTSRSC